MIGHINNGPPRRFNPSGKGGGSKKGKPQAEYPLLILVVADSIHIQVKGSMESMLYDRNMHVSVKEMRNRMEVLMPGIWKWLDKNLGSRATDRAELLKNRVYKMYYSGTSDRGYGHDPLTRASIAKEHWRRRKGSTQYEKIHSAVIQGKILSIPDWETML